MINSVDMQRLSVFEREIYLLRNNNSDEAKKILEYFQQEIDDMKARKE
jgi:ABC-type Fe3+-hydroxamate transport system substrate-binding protein